MPCRIKKIYYYTFSLDSPFTCGEIHVTGSHKSVKKDDRKLKTYRFMSKVLNYLKAEKITHHVGNAVFPRGAMNFVYIQLLINLNFWDNHCKIPRFDDNVILITKRESSNLSALIDSALNERVKTTLLINRPWSFVLQHYKLRGRNMEHFFPYRRVFHTIENLIFYCRFAVIIL